MIFPSFASRKNRNFKSRADVKNSLREFLFDTKTPNAYEISLAIGCTPLSQDVLEREEDESDKRIDAIAHLFPHVTTYSQLYSQAFLASMLDNMEDVPEELEGVVQEVIDKAQVLLEEALGNVLTGTLSQLVFHDVIRIPRRK